MLAWIIEDYEAGGARTVAWSDERGGFEFMRGSSRIFDDEITTFCRFMTRFLQSPLPSYISDMRFSSLVLGTTSPILIENHGWACG